MCVCVCVAQGMFCLFEMTSRLYETVAAALVSETPGNISMNAQNSRILGLMNVALAADLNLLYKRHTKIAHMQLAHRTII